MLFVEITRIVYLFNCKNRNHYNSPAGAFRSQTGNKVDSTLSEQDLETFLYSKGGGGGSFVSKLEYN